MPITVRVTEDGLRTVRVEGDVMPKIIYDALYDYILDCLNAMRLSHGQINLKPEYCREGAAGHILHTYGRVYGTMTVGTAFFSGHWKEQKTTIAHELVHLIHSQMTHYVERFVEDKVSSRQLADFKDTYIQFEELATDHLSKLIYPMLPPIPDFWEMARAIQEESDPDKLTERLKVIPRLSDNGGD